MYKGTTAMISRFLMILSLSTLILISCDVEELLNTTDPPEVSDIFSDAPGFIVSPMQTARFWVTASDPQQEVLTFEWGVNGGEYIGSRQNDTLTWRAPVTGGRYEVWVKVANSEKDVTRSKEVIVPSLTAPQVAITDPQTGEYVVQQSIVQVRATAISENGVFRTAFFVNDSLVSSQSGNPGNVYQFNWEVHEAAGETELKVVATANQTGLNGSDSIKVNVEGVIPGKHNAGNR